MDTFIRNYPTLKRLKGNGQSFDGQRELSEAQRTVVRRRRTIVQRAKDFCPKATDEYGQPLSDNKFMYFNDFS